MKLAACAVAVLAAVAACKPKAPEHSGVGPWRFTVTTLKDVGSGRCDPTTLTDGRAATWCYGVTPLNIADRPTEVDLYFAGSEPSARLIEIQLKVRGCVEADLDQWLRRYYGEPSATKATRTYWKNGFVWVAAFLPSEPGRCLVHVLPLSETAEIKRIEQM